MSHIDNRIKKKAPKQVEASPKPTIVLEKKTDKKTLKNSEQAITYTRELKWIYPADCTTAKDRKVFRQKNRGLIRRAEAHALKVEGKDKAELIAKAMEVRKVVLAKVDDLV